MMPVKNMCHECRHFDFDAQDANGMEAPRCAAFPDGIPPEIWVQGEDHREPFPGDRDIRFEPHEEADWDHIARWDQA